MIVASAISRLALYLARLLAFGALALLVCGLAAIMNFWWLLFWLLLVALGQG